MDATLLQRVTGYKAILPYSINMEEYTRIMTLACIPYAIARRTKSLKDLYFILDSTDHLENMNRPDHISLANCGDSCALDAVITSLFSHFKLPENRHYENKHRAKINNWFQSVNRKQDIKTLTPLFKNFPHEDDFFVLGEPKDAIEFLMYLLKIFSKDVVSTKIFKTVNSNGSITCARVDKESSPVQYISAIDLSTKEKIWVHDMIDNETTVNQNGDTASLRDRKKTKEEIVQGDIVIFACGRVQYDGRFVSTQVMATPTLTTPNGDRFFLGSVVVNFNDHYISYVRDRDDWFLYDDLSPKERKYIGSYDDVFSGRGGCPNPATNGVLYMYFPDYSSADEHLLSSWKTHDRNGRGYEELLVGVFEDRVTTKLLYLVDHFDSVSVSENLPALRQLTKVKSGDKRLTILDITSFLREK